MKLNIVENGQVLVTYLDLRPSISLNIGEEITENGSQYKITRVIKDISQNTITCFVEKIEKEYLKG